MGTKRIKYLGPYSETSIDDSGPTVKRGESVEVDDYYADPLLTRTGEWELVPDAPKGKKVTEAPAAP